VVSREVLKFQGVFQKKAPTDHDVADGNDSDKCGTRGGLVVETEGPGSGLVKESRSQAQSR
jgi:hypothetical protein